MAAEYLGDGVYWNDDQNAGYLGLTTGHHDCARADNTVWLEPAVEKELLALLINRRNVAEAAIKIVDLLRQFGRQSTDQLFECAGWNQINRQALGKLVENGRVVHTANKDTDFYELAEAGQ